MNSSAAIELSNTLTARQKSLIRDLLEDCIYLSDLSYVDLAPIFEALQNPSVYKNNTDLSIAFNITDRWMDGKLG